MEVIFMNVEAVEYKEVVDVDRIRRITGYLVGTTKKVNNAKFNEMKDRTKNIGRVGFQADKNIQ